MAKFEFRLQTLMRLRQATRDERRQQLAEALRFERQFQEQRQAISDKLLQLLEETRSMAGPGTVHVEELLTAQRYDVQLRRDLQHVIQQITLISAEVQRRRDALLEADRAVKVLENLKEKQLEAAVAEEAHREQVRLDEVGTSQFLRDGATG